MTSQGAVGSLARPAACPLAQLIVSPAERLGADLLDALLPPGTPFFSLRHLPGPPGATQVHELVRWNCDLAVRSDAFGDPLRFTGPASINYPTCSAIDPVHRLAVDTFLGGAYLEFDMRLTADTVVWSETIAAIPEVRPEPVVASV